MPNKHKAKVIFVLENLATGGVTRWALNLARGFEQLGITTEILTLFPLSQNSHQSDATLKIRSLNSRNFLSATINLVKEFYLNKKELQENPPIIISSLEGVNVITALSLYLTRSRARFFPVVQFHLSAKLQYDRRFALQVVSRLLKIAFHRAEKVIAVSNEANDDLVNSFGAPKNKVSTIFNAVCNANEFSVSHTKPQHPAFQDHSTKVIIGCGRLVKQKNFSLLIDAFQLVIRSKQSHLFIIGDGPDRSALEYQVKKLNISDFVTFTGSTDPYSYMQYADLLVMTSLYEGMPHVPIEALAFGIPLVSTDCPSGPKEIISSDEIGILADSSEPTIIAECIIKALSKHYSRNTLINRASEFSIEKSVKEYMKIFNVN